jgi:sigma-54 dependent transcriptional regulator, acetoin dehydrogenase operon transcriptional activator AcoR
MNTKTDPPGRDRSRRRDAEVDVLYIAFHGNEPTRLPSRHVLTDLDVVEFGRGPASVTRPRGGALRELTLRLPDPLMSEHHGKLVHARGDWLIDDPLSKNAVIVGGARTRSCRIEPGQLFSLGNTILFLAREAPGGPLDLDAGTLPAPRAELATFDPVLRDVLARMARLATSDMPILVLGETGTGKEVVSRAIHELSERRGPFVAVNCAAITPTLLEAELFGHRKAAFSGALTDRLGHIRTSDHGTLFLDEIAELSSQGQAALLRVLQEREVVPVGDTLPIPVDLRVVAATNRDLAARVADGAFREDLYARIAGFTVTLPPLCARRADLGLVIAALLRRLPGGERVRVTWSAAVQLFRYVWPRNIRELDRTLEAAAVLAGGDPIELEHLADAIRVAQDDDATTDDEAAAMSAITDGETTLLRAPLSPGDAERKQRLEELLRIHDYNVSEVARALGKDRTQIYRWLRRFGLRRDAA